jgi:hypothetical protein
MPILSKSRALLVALLCLLPFLNPESIRAQDTARNPSNIMVRLATNPASVPGGSTSPDSVGISLIDCKGEKAALDLKSVISTIPGATARQFQVNPDSDDPEDLDPKVTPTTRLIEVHNPRACQYVLRVEGYKQGSFELQLHAQGTVRDNGFFSFDAVPAYPEGRFELKFIFEAKPFKFETEGGLRPAGGAFSFAQPLTSKVQLPAQEKTLGIVIFYDRALNSSSFRVSLDGKDLSRQFHPSLSQQELVVVPLPPGQHDLVVKGKKSDCPSVQQIFHIEH